MLWARQVAEVRQHLFIKRYSLGDSEQTHKKKGGSPEGEPPHYRLLTTDYLPHSRLKTFAIPTAQREPRVVLQQNQVLAVER